MENEMNTYLQQTQKESVKTWINKNLVNYLKKNPENQSEIEHIIDYLNSDKAPTELAGLQYEAAKNNAEKWVKALQKKGRNIVETEADTENVLIFEDGFKLVKLIEEVSFKREGTLMGHCVASYYNKSDCAVYSLRDLNNKPHCTVEVQGTSNSSINQIKGKGNGPIHPNYIKYVIDILKYFKMDVRDSEMSNLGYSVLPDGAESWKFLEDRFKGIKYCTFNGKKYFYNKSKLVRL